MDKKAFTLIEILIVVIIIGVLAAMVTPQLVGRGEQAKRTAARADIEANISTAMDLYHTDNGRYPTTEQGLKALIEKPTTGTVADNWSGPYLKKKKMPQDPWGREYVYVCPGAHNSDEYDLSSLGPDGIQSSDDITNWSDDISQKK
jgi:general secretion pathway protein G